MIKMIIFLFLRIFLLKASEFWLGNKLELISDAGEETAVRLWMFHGGILNYFYSNGYLCYQTQYSGPFKVLEKCWDNICNLTEKRRPEKIIENVYRYFLCEERLIYEDTSGDLYYCNIKNGDKEKIKWKWDKYSEVFEDIQWKDRDTFYILNDQKDGLYTYSVKTEEAELVLKTDEPIRGIVPYQEERVLLVTESGKIIEYFQRNGRNRTVVTGLEGNLQWYDHRNNALRCPYEIIGDNLYYDKDYNIYKYNLENGQEKKVIDIEEYIPWNISFNPEDGNTNVRYMIGKKGIILFQETEKTQSVYFFDYAGNLVKQEMMPKPGWETGKYNLYRGP